MTKYYIWSCEYNNNTGEGRLAKKFIKYFYSKKKFKILTPKNNFKFSNYLYQIFGIFVLWFYFLLGKKTVYLNYLPLWNFLIFFLVPPKTEFGPITGSIQINKIKSIKSFFRSKLFPIFYIISLNLLEFRKKKIIFATNILIKFIKKSILKKSELNFVLKDFKKRANKSKKTIDLLIYYRKHENKFFDHHIDFIQSKLNKNGKVVILGDDLNLKGVINLGRVKKRKISELIKKSKFVLSGDDNLLSFFNLDCLSNKTKIIFNYKLKFQNKNLDKKLFLPYNFERRKFLNRSNF